MSNNNLESWFVPIKKVVSWHLPTLVDFNTRFILCCSWLIYNCYRLSTTCHLILDVLYLSFYFQRRKLLFLWVFNWGVLFRCNFRGCWRILLFRIYGSIQNTIYLLYWTFGNWADLRVNNNKWSNICSLSHAWLVLGSSLSCNVDSRLRIYSLRISY